MKYIKGQNREQTYLFPVSMDQAVDQNNEVRLIDLFVDSLKLDGFGFKMEHTENGRPAYHPSDLLKLFIYGYMNKVRSSRGLEKECKRNIEVIWLLKNLRPDHNTISNFRRDNSKAIQRSQYQTLIENNKARINADKKLYRKRQQIVEHPYGTIKRQWGFSYVSTKKTIARASADIGFMMTAYNLRRIINIVGLKGFREYLIGILAYYWPKKLSHKIKMHILSYLTYKMKNYSYFSETLIQMKY